MTKKRIAILGGGLGALSAAFELTSRPGWQDRYEIDLYQKGWRLGGKGASGRNAGEHQRIEEHGLHCFWGFYDYAFYMMRTCYDALQGKPGFFAGIDKTNANAFIPLDYVQFIDRANDGTTLRYQMNFPTNDRRPGMFKPGLHDVTSLGHAAIDMVIDILRKNLEVAKAFDEAIADEAAERLASVKVPWANAARLETFRALVPHGAAIDLLHDLASADTTKSAPHPNVKLAPGTLPDDAYRIHILVCAVKFILFALKGMLSEGVPTRLEDFSRFDDRDISEFLTQYGAKKDVVESPVVRGLYNSSFCHPQGDFAVWNLAAGTCLRVLFLMGLTYKGSFMWKMCAGMGDTIFAPLYQVLKDRGVRFHFFHHVRKLSLDDRKIDIASIELDVQARTKSGGEYAPFVRVSELDCWPNEPKWDLLDPTTPHQNFESDWADTTGWTPLTLSAGKDFDYVVCGIPVGALSTIASDLVEASPAWRSMVTEVKTVRTQSAQVWVKKDPQQMSWMSKNHIMTDVYGDPFNSIADMYQTMPREDWPEADAPGGVVYFSTPMPDDPKEPPKPNPAYPETQDVVVEKSWNDWMKTYREGVFGWLAPGQDLAIKSFFRTANIDGDARYVLSVAKSSAHRIWPEASGFPRLYLAGDWTKSPLDLGCAENATMSGTRAGDALATLIERGESPFIEYPGMPVFPPPYRQKDITLCQMVLEANASSMQAVLDKYLNPHAGTHRFRALGRWVIFQMGQIAVNNGAAPDTNFGTAAETSATFLVPCGRIADKCIEVGFFAPLILVSHPLSMVAGREVLGMAKQLATFEGDMPDHLDDTIVSTTTSDMLGPTSEIAVRELIRVRRTSAPPPEKSSIVRSLFKELASSRTITFFSVRQLRAVGDPSMASTSEITRGRMRLGKVAIEPFAKGHTVEIVPRQSHPIATLFGFSGASLRPVASAKFHVDEASLDVEP